MSTALGTDTVVRSQWWRGQRWDTLLSAFVDLAGLPDLRGGTCVDSELPAKTWDLQVVSAAADVRGLRRRSRVAGARGVGRAGAFAETA